MMKRIYPVVETTKENEDYMLIGTKHMLYFYTMENASKEVLDEWDKLMKIASEYDKQNVGFADDIVIRKDSLIGNYIISLIGSEVDNDDDIVYFNKVVNALNIAIFDKNPIAKDLVIPFQNQIHGLRENLIDEYSFEVIDYILKNNDFDFYLRVLNGEYEPKKYLVYENGCLTKRTITEPQKKIKMTNDL